MMDLETMEWAANNPEKFREWRDKPKTFWFTVQNRNTGKTMRLAVNGSTMHVAMERLELPSEAWEII